MAGFVTANRWATGVETHKTREGRILCTGVGCVGCFPEVYTVEANELGLCDVDLRGQTLPFRTFLEEDFCTQSNQNTTCKEKTYSKSRPRRRKPKCRAQQRKMQTGKASGEREMKAIETGEGNSAMSSVGTQTAESSDLVTEGQTGISKNFDSGSKEVLSVLDEAHETGEKNDTSVYIHVNENQIGANCNIDFGFEDTGSVNKTHRNLGTMFDRSLVSSAARIHDKMYIASGKDIALSLCDSDDHCFKSKDDSTRLYGEDAVCFFFTLEYYGSQRMLPQFRVMEIIEALGRVVELEDVKCVQRIYHRWHIVLKNRKYTGILRNMGLQLRGRVYQLIDDVDSYFDVVQ